MGASLKKQHATNISYNIPLPRGPGPTKKLKDNERGNPGGLKKRRIPHGDTKYLLGTVVQLIQI
jgi:hypothetical protein